MRESKRPKFDDELVQSIPLAQFSRKKTSNERPSPELTAFVETVNFKNCLILFF